MPRRQPQRSREDLLPDRRDRLHPLPVADCVRHVRVLAEEQQILEHQAEDDARRRRRARGGRADHRDEQRVDRELERSR